MIAVVEKGNSASVEADLAFHCGSFGWVSDNVRTRAIGTSASSVDRSTLYIYIYIKQTFLYFLNICKEIDSIINHQTLFEKRGRG
jgi:hypothetical protein